LRSNVPLRLELQGQRPLEPDLHTVKATQSSHDETYHLVTGKSSQVRDHYNTLRIDLEESDDLGRNLAIETRAYDVAVAFRYVVPEQNTLRNLRLTKESTEFRIAKDATSYAFILPNFHSMYESEFVKLPMSAFYNQGGVASKILLGLPC
jgi:alpha-glucosidase